MSWWDKKPKKFEPLTVEVMAEKAAIESRRNCEEFARIWTRFILDKWRPYTDTLPIPWETQEDILFEICKNIEEVNRLKLILIEVYHENVLVYCREHGIQFTPQQVEAIQSLNLVAGMGFRTFYETWSSGVETLGQTLINRETKRKQQEERKAKRKSET